MFEILIVAVVVVWSCIIVFKNVMPKTANKTFVHLAVFCEKQGWTTLAKYLAPKKAAGCGGGCNCGSDSTGDAVEPQEIKTVKWK